MKTGSLFFSVAALLALAVAPLAKGDVIPVKPEDERIMMWEGGCFYPTCTEYEFSLARDGSYVLKGMKNTKTAGETKGKLGPDAWDKAEAALKAAKFYDWPTQLNAQELAAKSPLPCMNHLPGVHFTRKLTGDLSRVVKWDSGCPYEPAAKLRDELRVIFKYDTLIKPAAP